MASILEIVSKPISEDQPCGPDLDVNEDKDYWLAIGRIEPALPKSLAEYEKFPDRNIPIKDEVAALTKVLERSHDMKVVTLIARLRILGQDLDGFIDAVEAMGYLVMNRWENFHPQGDIDYRLSLIESLEFLPDTGYPLRDTPLFTSPRLGKVSYRLHLLATGALTNQRLSDTEDEAAEAEDAPRPYEISSAAKSAKIDEILASRDKVLSLLSIVEGIEANFTDKADTPLRLTALKDLSSKILDFLNFCVGEKDPSLAAPSGPPPGLTMQEAAEHIAVAQAPGSVGNAVDADAYLRGIEDYYGRHEPSSPVRLYVAQSRALIGKSFAEAIGALLPELVDQANLPIGGDLRARLPLSQLASLLSPARSSDVYEESLIESQDDEADPDEESDDGDDEGRVDLRPEPLAAPVEQPPFRTVLTRQAAIQSIDAVIAFFRQTEPSSPIPLLLGQARSFATEDFLGALRSVLPMDSFVVDE